MQSVEIDPIDIFSIIQREHIRHYIVKITNPIRYIL